MSDEATITDADIDAAVAEAEANYDKAANPDKPSKPEWCEDKFWDAEKGQVNSEALAKSYQELQSKQSQPKGEDDKTDEKPADEAKVEAPPELKAALDAAGINFDAVAAEYAEKGEVSPESRAKLEAAFGKNVVDNYFNGLAAQATTAASTYEANVRSAAGADFDAAKSWADDNMTPAEIAEFDAHVRSGDEARAKLAVQGLVSKFQAEGGKAPNLVQGKNGSQNSDSFASIDEMATAMNDARYRDRKSVV